MRQSSVFLAAALAGLAGGAVGALLSLATRSARDAAPAELPVSAPAPSQAGRVGELARDLGDVRSLLDAALLRIASLEGEAALRRTPLDAPAPDLATREVPPDDDLRSLQAAPGEPGGPLPEELKQGVAEILQHVREAERQERAQLQAEAIEERTEERLAELTQELGLTPVQTTAMREHMNDYSKRRTELFEESRRSGDFYSVRDSMRSLRREADEALAAILDPVQLDRYHELEDDRPRGDRRGNGGDRGSRRRD